MDIAAAVKSPWPVLLTIALDRKTAVGKIGERAHRADTAAPLPGRDDVLTQFVAIHVQRQMRLNILDRIIACVGIERIDGIHAVEAVAPAVTALENLHMNPGLLLDGAAE